MINHKEGYLLGDAAQWWYLFVGAGIFALLAPYFFVLQTSITRVWIVGSLAILAGACLRLHYFGTQVDSEKGQIRNFYTIFGIRKGEWKPLNGIVKIYLTSQNTSSWSTPNGVSPSFKSNITTYTVGLFDQTDDPQYFLQTTDLKKAKQLASSLSDGLSIPTEGSFQ